jgi:hypothetical protein
MIKIIRIGTLNFHRAQNYGALLLAYALKTWCEKQKAEVRCLNYFPAYHAAHYPNRRPDIEAFVNTFLLPEGSMNEEYDLVIYGSDTIWKRFRDYGFDKVYWGTDVIRAKRKITYAASTVMSDFNEESDALFRKHLPDFDAVSVREDVLRHYLRPFAKTRIFLTCDPAFLLTADEWSALASPRLMGEEYCIIYNQQYGEVIYDIAGTFSEKAHLPVYICNGDGKLRGQKGNVLSDAIGPQEFLSLIKYAQYIFTSSFHGVAFAVIFRKQFFSMVKTATERVESLLRILSLENRRIYHSSEIDRSRVINYAEIERNLQTYISGSEKYLVANLI